MDETIKHDIHDVAISVLGSLFTVLIFILISNHVGKLRAFLK